MKIEDDQGVQKLRKLICDRKAKLERCKMQTSVVRKELKLAEESYNYYLENVLGVKKDEISS
jgi:hypothetical protein